MTIISSSFAALMVSAAALVIGGGSAALLFWVASNWRRLVECARRYGGQVGLAERLAGPLGYWGSLVSAACGLCCAADPTRTSSWAALLVCGALAAGAFCRLALHDKTLWLACALRHPDARPRELEYSDPDWDELADALAAARRRRLRSMFDEFMELHTARPQRAGAPPDREPRRPPTHTLSDMR